MGIQWRASSIRISRDNSASRRVVIAGSPYRPPRDRSANVGVRIARSVQPCEADQIQLCILRRHPPLNTTQVVGLANVADSAA